MTASQNATSPPLLSRAELRACLMVLLVAAAWSALLSCIYWPGLATEDGATRSVHALALLGEPQITPNFLSHWFPPGLTLLMSASLRWFGTLGPVTMLQAFWVAASLGWLLVLSAGPRLGLLFLTLPLIYPPLFTHSIAHLADGWSVAALASLASCTVLWHRRAKSQHTLQSPSWLRALITLLLVSSCLALLTFRANGVTVMPLLAICMLWLVRPATRAIAGLVVIGACMAATPLLIQNIPWPRRDTVATSLIWEHVGMLKLSQDPKLATQYSLDDVCIPPANTKSLIERHNWVTHDSIMFRSPQVLQSSKVMKADDNVVRKRFKELASNEPLLYLRMKLQTWRTLMGLRGGIPLIYIWNKAPTWTQPLGTSFERTGPPEKMVRSDQRMERVQSDATGILRAAHHLDLRRSALSRRMLHSEKALLARNVLRALCRRLLRRILPHYPWHPIPLLHARACVAIRRFDQRIHHSDPGADKHSQFFRRNSNHKYLSSFFPVGHALKCVAPCGRGFSTLGNSPTRNPLR